MLVRLFEYEQKPNNLKVTISIESVTTTVKHEEHCVTISPMPIWAWQDFDETLSSYKTLIERVVFRERV